MNRIDKFKYYDVVIYADRGSNSARRLATFLGSRRWRSDLPQRYTRRRPYFRGNSSPLVVNWGSSHHPGWLADPRFRLNPVILNHGDRVKEAINKLTFFQKASGIDGVPIVKWSAEVDVAKGWIGKGSHVLCRKSLTGSGGQGIILAKTVEDLVEAPLYTRHYPKTHEYRVHVFKGKVIDLTEKKFKGGKDARANSGEKSLIRCHTNGWVHCHGDVSLSGESVIELGNKSIRLLNGLSLDFGACDIMAILEPPDADGKRRLKNFVICEVNTGPGLENTKTIEAYGQAILACKTGDK